MQLSVREAAERVGVTRQTIFKKIKDGELSATIDHRGNKQIDVSELLRVYGQLQSNYSQQSTTVNKARQLKLSPISSDLQLELDRSKMLLQMKDRELDLAHERIAELKARETELKQRDLASTEERMRLLGVIEIQNRLLSAPPPAPKLHTPTKPKTGATSTVTTSSKQPIATPKTVVNSKNSPAKSKTATKAVTKTGTKTGA